MIGTHVSHNNFKTFAGREISRNLIYSVLAVYSLKNIYGITNTDDVYLMHTGGKRENRVRRPK